MVAVQRNRIVKYANNAAYFPFYVRISTPVCTTLMLLLLLFIFLLGAWTFTARCVRCDEDVAVPLPERRE